MEPDQPDLLKRPVRDRQCWLLAQGCCRCCVGWYNPRQWLTLTSTLLQWEGNETAVFEKETLIGVWVMKLGPNALQFWALCCCCLGFEARPVVGLRAEKMGRAASMREHNLDVVLIHGGGGLWYCCGFYVGFHCFCYCVLRGLPML